MNINREFSKNAQKYQQLNQIQTEVAKKLVNTLSESFVSTCKPKKILDLGCGSGAIYKLIDWELEKFVGVDFSQNMLSLHPKSTNLTCKLGDFNDAKLFSELREEDFDFIISASALQWADDLGSVFRSIANFNLPFSLAIFSSGTFATLNKTAGVESIIPSFNAIKEVSQKCLHVNPELSLSVEKVLYTLEFENTREMFRYIKKSGVSGNRNLLTYKQTKKLMQEYPLNYLEFEVVYINSFSKA
jgi:malonyl-CoA O-methyltransferase